MRTCKYHSRFFCKECEWPTPHGSFHKQQQAEREARAFDSLCDILRLNTAELKEDFADAIDDVINIRVDRKISEHHDSDHSYDETR